jgi:hypothetical protein
VELSELLAGLKELNDLMEDFQCFFGFKDAARKRTTGCHGQNRFRFVRFAFPLIALNEHWQGDGRRGRSWWKTVFNSGLGAATGAHEDKRTTTLA